MGSEVGNQTPDSCIEDCDLCVWYTHSNATPHNAPKQEKKEKAKDVFVHQKQKTITRQKKRK